MVHEINQIRQGDVLLIRRSPPTSSTRIASEGLRVLGERTGHAHMLPAEVHELADRTRLLHLERPTLLTHEEHAEILVPEGWWEPVLQREYTERAPERRAKYD